MSTHAKGKSCDCENDVNNSCGCITSSKKSSGCNDWDSVPRTYDAEESCHKHEKTATNNQWCSCSK